MSFKPKVSVTIAKSTGIKILDSTGVYNATTNPGGFGAPNPELSDVSAILVQQTVIGKELPAAVALTSLQRDDYLGGTAVPTGNSTLRDGVYDIRALIGFPGASPLSATAGSSQFSLTNASTVFLTAVGFTIDSIDPEKLYRIDRTKTLTNSAGYVVGTLPTASNLDITIYYEAQKYALVYDQGEACLLDDIAKIGCGCNSEEVLKLTERYARYLSMLQRFNREADYPGAHKIAVQLQNDCDPQCLPCGTSGHNTGVSSESDTCIPPTITVQPAAVAASLGSNAAFTITATGTPALKYQWRKNGIDIVGAVSATLNILNVQNADAAVYTVVVWNECGKAVSSGATLTITAGLQAVVITVQPQSQVVAPGTDVIFSIGATGSPVISYQWRKNGVALVGETGSTLTLTGVDGGDEADYDCIVSNPVNSVTSDTATLTLGELALWGWKDSIPETTDDILALQSGGPFTPGGTITADFRANGEPKYLIMAEPSTEPEKTSWYANALNNGPLSSTPSGPSSAFYVLGIIGSYRVYISAYLTYNTENVIEFRV